MTKGENVYKIGDLVVYGNAGVCRVDKIGRPDLAGFDDGKDYYTLSPYYSDRSRIFTPCDSDRVIMRSVISKSEARKVIDSIESSELVVVEEEKYREAVYKEVMKECDCLRFASLLKTISIRKAIRISEGKKVTANDEKYYNMAREKLCDELAVALNEDRDKVCTLVDEKVNTAAAG